MTLFINTETPFSATNNQSDTLWNYVSINCVLIECNIMIEQR